MTTISMSTFDPYYDWLGIPKADRADGAPHHYRLLGLALYESNPRVIENAADRLMTQLRGFANGPHSKDSQKLLNEVAAAQACLLNEKRKSLYDKGLREKLAAAAPKPQAPKPIVQPVYVQVPVPVPVPTAMPPMPSATPAPPPPAEENQTPWSSAPAAPFKLRASGSRGRYHGGSSAGSSVLGLVKVVLGGLGGLSIAVLGVWIFFKSDPLGLFKQPAPVVAQNVVKPEVKPESPTQPVVKPEQPAVVTMEPSPAKPVSKPESPVKPTPKPSPAVVVVTPATPSSEPNPAITPNPRPLPGTEESSQGTPSTPTTSPAVDERHQPPTPEEQQAKLAELKEVYKSEFDAGLKPSGREAFADFLLATTDRLKSDHVARFVLLREAYNRLVQLKEFDAAAEVVDRLDAEFVTDPFKSRLHLLTEASAAAKLPAERLAIVHCASDLVEQAIAQQRIEEADKLVRIAEGQAKTLSDSKLRAKMTAQKLEVEKLAEGWQPVLRARAALANNPADAAAALVDGKHRCLVEGDWKAGLELLAKSEDAALAAAAKQDLAGPTAEVAAGVIADQWYEIARADKDLAYFYARARHWYKRVPAAGANLDQARIQQRIEQIEAMNLPERLLDDGGTVAANDRLPSFAAAYARTQSFEAVDLLQHVQRQDLAASPWGATSDMPPMLYSDDETTFGRLPVRYPPPREYQLTIRVRRGGDSEPEFPRREDRASGPFVIGLVGPKGPFLACIDLPLMGEHAAFLSAAGAKSPADNPTFRKLSFAQIRDGSETTIVCQVRRRSVSVTINTNEVCRFEGDLSQLALPKEWSVNDPKALFIGSHQCGYSVSGWTLEPLPAEAPASTEALRPAFNAEAKRFDALRGG
jgi:hypothetical protein